MTTGVYGFWRVHVRSLLVAADVPGPDALIDVLLAPLAPEVFRYQREERALSTADISAALCTLARRVLG